MKKILLFLLSAAACSPQDENLVNGYIEGEYVYISPYAGGILDEINVVKGQEIKPGDKLFTVDGEIWKASIRQAENELDKAYANYANLSKGKRQQELDVIIEQKVQAEALFRNAGKEYERARELLKTKNISRTEYDRRFADYEESRARLAELEATLETAKLPAREDELKAARNDIEIAGQNRLKIQKQAENNETRAKVSGRVEDIYFRLGEYVQTGNPVLSVLPPENVKIRFFVSEKALPGMKLNMPVTVECDGCSRGIPAKVSFISTRSEFTPPVIYSVESREKLVFMIEAVFDNKQQNLPPGLPVSVKIGNND